MVDDDLESVSSFAALWCQMLVLRNLCMFSRAGETFLVASRKDPLKGAVVIASLVGTVFPCLEALLVAVALDFAKRVSLAPLLDNNATYVLWVTPNILLGTIYALMENPSTSSFQASLAPVRGLALLLYGFAAFAKLNPDFLDVGVSGHTAHMVQLLKLMPDSIWPAPSEPLLESSEEVRSDSLAKRLFLFSSMLTMLVEFAVPIGIFCGWPWVFLLALSMHLLMGLAGQWPFSVVMQAAVVLLWAPQTLPGALRFMLLEPASRMLLSSILLTVFLTHNNKSLTFPGPLARIFTNISNRTTFTPGSSGNFLQLAWFMWSLSMLWGVIASGLKVEQNLPILPALDGSLLSVVGWLTFISGMILGASPYLGLRTHGTWSMFSNLRLEGNQSNHWLIPAWLQPFSFLQDAVVVLESDDPGIARFMFGVETGRGGGPRLASLLRQIGAKPICYFNAHGGGAYGAGEDLVTKLPYGVPYLQLRRLVSRRCMEQKGDFFVRYRRAGKEHVFQTYQGLPAPGSDLTLAKQPSFLVCKFLVFRSFTCESGPEVCNS